MRGDRPHLPFVTTSLPQFTPHARGSTSKQDVYDKRRFVYPACAGIDPAFITIGSIPSGLPRMRGDRPTEPIEWFRLIVFTPHTRGQIAVRRV